MLRLLPLTRNELLRLGTATGFAYACVTAGPKPAAHMIPVAPSTVAVDSVHTLTFEWGAVNLALQSPYDTVQLQAIPRTATGAVMHIPVSYSSSDREISVSSTGLVTARIPTTETLHTAHVIASVTQGGRTLTDTAVIQVTPTPLPAPLATLSIHPQPGGLTSAHGNLGNTQFTLPVVETFPFFATMATGDPSKDTVCTARRCRYPLLVHFTSSDTSIAYVDDTRHIFYPRRVGRVIFTISTIAYGVRKIDSLPFSIGYDQRTSMDLYVGNLRPPVLAIRRGLFWDGLASIPYSVGLHVYITNHAGEQVEVRLPAPAHGVHFGWSSERRVDTLAARADADVIVVLDSAGTHVLQSRGLQTGAVRSDTITVLPYP